MEMRTRTPESGFSPLAVPFGLSVFFLVVAIVFGSWAYMQMLDYKNNSDAKVAVAVAQAKLDEDKVKDAAFAQAEKQPLTTYQGPSAYGSVSVSYPKTWSAYVDGYFNPSTVPDVNGSNSVFALRVQVVQDAYSDVVANFSSLVRNGKVTVSPYAVPKVSNVIGVRVDGQLAQKTNGSMIILPLRNTTLKVWTEAPQFENDLNTNILPNLTFRP
jgi:hypothetical protein